MKKWERKIVKGFKKGFSISVLASAYVTKIEPQLLNSDTFCYETNARFYIENLIRKQLRDSHGKRYRVQSN